MANNKSSTSQHSKTSKSKSSSNNLNAKFELKNGVEKVAHNKLFILIAVFLVVGIIIGFGGGYLVTKNDTFKLNGEDEIELHLLETYEEQGAKAIAFGKDISKSVKIEGNVDTSVPGTYVLKYTCNNFKYKKITRIRYVVVLEVEDEG